MAKKTAEKRAESPEEATGGEVNPSVELARRLQATVDEFIAENPEKRRALVPRSFDTVISRLWGRA